MRDDNPGAQLGDLRRKSSGLRALGDVRLFELQDGPARGQRRLELRNAAGLVLEVAVDRSFDLACLSWCGANLGWRGPVTAGGSPAPEGEGGLGLLRSFDGFLVTCGLDHYGLPAQGPGEHFRYPHRKTVHYPLHGRVSAEPATLRGYGVEGSDASATLWCEGLVRQAALFGENLLLHRRIEVPMFSGAVRIIDRVVNEGWRPARHGLLYHFNLGYPLLDEGAELIGDFKADLRERFLAEGCSPGDDTLERVEDATPATPSRRHEVGLRNLRLAGGTSLSIGYDPAQLGSLSLWRAFQSGIYALGVEPHTGLGGDLAYHGPGTAHFLEAGAERRYELEVRIASGPAQ